MPRPSQYRGLWLTLALALCGRHGVAEPAPGLRLAFQYDADPSLQCPSEPELRASITRQLGYDPFAASAEQRLRVNVSKVANRAEARIEWIDSHEQSEGERRLASDDGDCTALARSLAFAVAVQIQLHASANEPPPTEPVPAQPPPTPPSPPPAASADKPPPHPEKTVARRRMFLGAGAMLRQGTGPEMSPGLRAFGGLSSERWSLELSGHGTLTSSLEKPDGTGFSANELGANLVPCVRFSPVGACAVGTLSWLRVRGHGVDRVGAPSAVSIGVGARLQLIWPALERFGVILQGEALAMPARQDVLLNRTVVWSTAPVVFAAILDFATIFP
ncbi:MAG: hypothetical protein ABUL60_27585 [Myxococcales bacterium]